ncbi:MAG: CHAT domain-containing protein [Thermoanaerobaculia bacterium]|nr:CHAT domain-containing protein [Thermoanaerobaculia bacterium]
MRGRHAAPAAGSNDVTGAARWVVGSVLPLAMANFACERQPRPPEIRSAADLPAAMAWALAGDCRMRPYYSPELGGCELAGAQTAARRPTSDPASRVPEPRSAAFHRLAALEGGLRRSAHETSVDSTLARAAWRLLWTEDATELRAIAADLGRETESSGGDDRLRLALSAVQLELARVEGTARWAVEALESALRLEAGALAPQARRNRRLALESLFGPACDDEGCPPPDRPSCLAILEDGVLAWARHLTAAPAGSDPSSPFGPLAKRLRADCGDDLLEILALDPSDDGAALRRSATAITTTFAPATAHVGGIELAAARRELEWAASAEGAGGRGLRAYSASRLSWLEYQLGDLASARRAALRGLGAIGDHNPVLRGRLLWQLGTLDGAAGDWGGALILYLRALAIFERVGDGAVEAALQSRIAEIYLDGGAVDTAWRYLGSSLARFARAPAGDRRAELLLLADRAAHESGAAAAADLFSNWAVAETEAEPTSFARVVALQARVARLASTGDRSKLRAAANRLAETMRSISPPDVRALVEADGRLQRGLAESDRVLARTLLEDAGRTFVRAGLLDSASRADLARLRLEVEDGAPRVDSPGLERVLAKAAVSYAAAPRDKRPGLRRDLARLVEALLARRLEGAPAIASLAIDQWERMQLLGLPGSALPGIDRSLESIAATSNDAQHVVFRVAERQTLRWSIRSGRWTVATLPVGRRELRRLAEDLLRQLAEGEAHARPAMERLAALLFGEVAEEHRRPRRVVLLPDDALWRLPLTLLFETAVGASDDTTIALAHVLGEPFERNRGRPAPPAQTLLVRGVRNATLSWLGAVDSADREAAAVRGASGAEIRELRGSGATRRSVLEALGEVRRAHFSVHGVGAEGRITGGLVLADSADDLGILTAQDLRQADLRHLELVVLASCQGPPSELRDVGSAGSMAEAFVAGGARAAIGSLGEVDDRSSSEFFVRFYESLGRGESVESAFAAARAGGTEKVPIAASPMASYQLYLRSAVDLSEGVDRPRRNPK